MSSLETRLYFRYLSAREFSSPEALKDYLQEHPKADPHKHTVSEHGKDHGEGHGKGHGGNMLGRLKGALKGLASKLKDAPAAAQKFVADPEHRKEALSKGVSELKKTPGKYAKNLIKAAKHEVHEFKEAGSGIAAVMKGGKPSAEQKKAIKTVATHMAITAAAAVLTTASPALAGLTMGKAMAKHVALKAVAETLGDLHVLEEVAHIGHGVAHLLKLGADEDSGQTSPEDALAGLVMQKVIEQMQSMSDDELAEALGGSESKEASLRVANAYLASQI